MAVKKVDFDMQKEKISVVFGTTDFLHYEEHGFCVKVDAYRHDMDDIIEALDATLEITKSLVSACMKHSVLGYPSNES